MTVANTILAQLGGAGRLSVMIGAHGFTADGPALIFKFKARAKRGIKAIKVTLDASDTYSVEFYMPRGSLRRGTYTVETRGLSGVYADSLRDVIEYETGLALSLGTCGRVAS